MSDRQIVVCETPEDVADAAADILFNCQTEALAERGIFRIALSGGSTPRLLYEALVSEEWFDEMQWEAWEVFWSDERCVAPDSADSNYRLAHAALLRHVPIADLFRFRGEQPDSKAAALDYARTLTARFGPGTPVFDVILLGMGADGHTASLFPNHPALHSTQLIEAVEVEQNIRHRMTFTLNLINRARNVIFMVTGAEKSERVRQILKEDRIEFPAAQVNPLEGECFWLLDQAAAAQMR